MRGDEQDIEECINDTFLSVWRAFGDENHRIVNLKGYLACTARNTAINLYRQLSKRNVINIDDIDLADESDMLLEFENKNNAIVLQELIAAMDEPDREIFIRKYFLFEKIRNIATRTGLDLFSPVPGLPISDRQKEDKAKASSSFWSGSRINFYRSPFFCVTPENVRCYICPFKFPFFLYPSSIITGK